MFCDFSILKTNNEHVHSDVELFFVVDGEVDFSMEGKTYLLKKDDFLIVNVDTLHGYKARGELLTFCVHVPYSELIQMLKKDMALFWCNTSVENNESCDEVRSIIRKLIWEEYNNKGRDEIYVNSLYYQMLHILTHDFLVDKSSDQFDRKTHKFDERKQQIEEYIKYNYNKNISLNELSKKLYLSNAYLSKYIKKQFGLSFVEYVNSVRLNNSVQQLLYSDTSVVRIAMDNGFASAAAFNKTFKEKYGMTPTVFRKQWLGEADKKSRTREEEQEIRQKVNKFFKDNPKEKPVDNESNRKSVILTDLKKEEIKPSWNKMINIGSAMDLLNSNVQKHLLYLKNNLGFKYVRFWDLYTPEMYLINRDGEETYNYDNLDRIIDFLLENDLKPYMELRAKPKKIVRNARTVLLYSQAQTISEDKKNVEAFFGKMFRHLVNRYRVEEVETWYFELWKTELEKYVAMDEVADKMTSVPMYIELFDFIAGIIKRYVPNVKFGGGGFGLRYGEDIFREILSQWKKKKNQPYFISIYCYPYTPEVGEGKNQSMDSNIIVNSIETCKRIIKEEKFDAKEFHVTEWNFSVSNRNVLNDHVMKGAYLVKNMSDCINGVDLMGYWTGSDLYGNYYDTDKLLNGCGGLLTKDGIPKPAYYAFEFMNRLGKYLYKRGDNYVISGNGGGNWRILCHNLKKLDYHYGLQFEDELTLDNVGNVFTDNKRQYIHFELPALKEGNYLIRTYSVNKGFGSIQDEWISMSEPEELRPEDLKYLTRITTPHMVLETQESKNGKVNVDIVLEPNEIKFIHVVYRL